MVPNPFSKCPADVFELSETLAARRCNWTKSFSLQRVEKARACYASCSFDTSSYSSYEDFQTLMGMPTFCDKQAAKAKAATEAAKQPEVITRVRDSIPDAGDNAPPQRNANASLAQANVAVPGSREVVMGVRPNDSSLVQHKDKGKYKSKAPSQKCTAVNKGKCIAEEKAPKKPKQNANTRTNPEPMPLTAAPTFPVVAEVPYNDASSSALLFSKITSPGDRFPPPNILF